MVGRSEDFNTSRNAHLFGAGIGALQGAGPTAGAPFEPARGRAALGRSYDMEAVRSAAGDKDYPTTEVDPRSLSKVQPSVVRDGVAHYMGDHSETYADANGKAGAHMVGNRTPIVYKTDDGQESVIMAGHHRATAALLSGQMLQAKVVVGPWTTRRKSA